MPRRYSSMRARLEAMSRPVQLVEKLGPCRIWQGCLNSSGYGVVQVRGMRRDPVTKHRKVKRVLAHRMSLADALGKKPYQLKYVLHACDNKPCIEPAHLRSSTLKQNALECVERGRHNSQKGRDDEIRLV